MQSVLYEFLYQSDIDNLQNLCLIDKEAKRICYDKYFWYNYFDKHNLEVITDENTPQQWIHEFKSLKNAHSKTSAVIDYLMSNSPLEIFSFYLTEFDSYKKIPIFPQSLIHKVELLEVNYKPKELTFYREFDLLYMAYTFISNDFNVIEYNFRVDLKQLKYTLFMFYYYCYKHYIPIYNRGSGDRHYFPYIYENIIKDPFYQDEDEDV